MKIATVIVTTLLSLTALQAQATAPADTAAVEVAYGDLNLDRMAGIATLYQRIRGASQRVCDAHDGRTLVAKGAYSACVDGAIADAVARINRPMLSQYVAQQTGKAMTGTPARVAVR